MQLREAAPPFSTMRQLPAEDRPRERLGRVGAPALSNPELLAILLGTGRPGASALDIAALLAAAGLRAVAGRSLAELAGEPGVGVAKAARILAALELGSRLSTETAGTQPLLRTPEEAARYVLPRYSARPLESFGVLALDTRHRLKKEILISTGSIDATLVHPREVFREALVLRAASVVLFHNHPSGDPEPSAEDLQLTRRLVQAGALLGIAVLDHLVLGAGRYVSLKQRGAV